ncbi:hypothetical protein KL943_000074 [Ogataea angusta]|nr:hypothetical protein KL943_000074 [Ogataea angusta]
MESISAALHSYIRGYDRDRLSRELERAEGPVDMGAVQFKASDYLQQLECCNLLWVIRGLITELSESLSDEVLFDSAVSNYKKLLGKVKELKEMIAGEAIIVTEINKQTQEFGVRIKQEMVSLLSKYLDFQDGSFRYNNKHNDVTFLEYLSWSYEFCALVEDEFLHHFGFNRLFGRELSANLGRANKLSYDGEQIVLEFGSQTTFSGFLQSIENTINFFNLFMDHNRNGEKYHLGAVKVNVSRLLMAALKERIFDSANIYSLILSKYGAGDSKTIGQLQVISELLAQDGWSRDGTCDLEFWIDDLVSYWVETLVDKKIDEIKEMAISGEFEKLEKEELCEKEAAPADEDDWNDEWDKDWDDNPDTPESPTKVAEDDGWDAWNEDWKDDKNDLGVKSLSTNSKSSNVSATVKYSSVCSWMKNLVADYYNNYEQLNSKAQSVENAEHLFKINIKKLVVCYFMVVSESYSGWVSFYTDYSKIVDDLAVKYSVNLESCHALKQRFRIRHVQQYLETIFKTIRPHEDVLFHDNGYENSVRARHSKALLRELDEVFGEINKAYVNGTGVNNVLVHEVASSMVTQVSGYLSQMLVSRSSIDSEESQILSDTLAGFLRLLVPSELPELRKIQSYQKLEQVKLVLDSGLREILDSFYDAKFFELATSELIGLVRSLFVDSSLRQSVIDEILEMRSN